MQLVQFFILFACTVVTLAENAPIVHIVQGKLRGKVVKSWTGKSIYSFMGVQFAKAPTGSDRLKVCLGYLLLIIICL